MRRERLYVACQLAGWGGLFAVNLGLNLVGHPFDWSTVASLAAIAAGGALGTHAFRAVARRRGWAALSVPRLVPRALLGVVAIGAVVGPVSTWLGFALDPVGTAAYREALDTAIAAGQATPRVWLVPYVVNAVNVMIYAAAWVAVYAGVHIARRAAEAEAERLRADRDRLQTEVALAAARMRALEYQLNPHFLFNALNTVRALVHADAAEADRAVTKLSGLLRRTLAAGREVAHPLAAELDLVRTYLDLEALRFGDRLAVRVDAEPALLGVPVPALLVQTLVENAVKHGVARRPGRGEVAVRAVAAPPPGGSGEGLCLRVENPMPEGDADPAEGTGLGLTNARERLALLYGDAATLAVGREGDRVVAEVRIPRAAPPSVPAPLSETAADA